MLISDAIPVQFWLNGEPSFNELDEAGVDKICFYQPWNCDDEIKIQIPVDADGYTLKIYDEDSVLLETLEFDTTMEPGEINEFDSDDISGADEFGVGNVWDGNIVELIIPSPMASDNSNLKFFEFNKPAQVFTVNVSWILELISGFVSSTTIHFSLRKSDIAEEIEEHSFSISGASGTQQFTIEADEPVYYIGVYISALSGEAGTTEVTLQNITIQDASVSSGYALVEFNMSDLEICDKLVRLKIFDEEDNELAYSDLLDIQENHLDTRLISYTNELDFAGIQYDVDYPPTFHIRVKSKFYTPRNQQETESEPDAEGNVIKLSSSSKKQKQLVIDPVPPYMHDKLILILQHNSIYINNRSWVQEDNYEINEINERFGLFSGSVWLTQMDDNFYTNVG